MSFVTYVLLIALHTGQSANFSPEIFGKVSTKDFAILILHTIVLKSSKIKTNNKNKIHFLTFSILYFLQRLCSRFRPFILCLL